MTDSAIEEMKKMLRAGKSCVLGWDKDEGKMAVKEISLGEEHAL